MIFSLLILSALWVSTAHAAETAPASPQTTFFHANALYKDGQYEAAAQEYEQLLQSRLASGNVYFNLGNAYFKAGKKGKAILNYERARRFIPGDPDLRANLEYAQSLTGAEACAPALWTRVAFPLARRMASRQLLWTSSALYTLLVCAVVAYRLWPRRPRWLIYVAAVFAVSGLIATTSFAQQVLTDDWQHHAVVTASGDTAARFEPAQNGTLHFTLKEGSLVRVLETREGWVQVARCDGRRGWIEKQAIENL